MTTWRSLEVGTGPLFSRVGVESLELGLSHPHYKRQCGFSTKPRSLAITHGFH